MLDLRRISFPVFLCLLLGALSLSAAGRLKPIAPENRAVVSPLTDLQRLASRLPLAQLEALWQDRVFVGRLQANPGASLPQGIRLAWRIPEEAMAGTRFQVLVSPGEKLDRDACAVYESSSAPMAQGRGQAILQNLLPGTTYAWKVRTLDAEGKVLAESPVRSFTVEAGIPFPLYWNHRANLRDLGGMTAAEGRRIPFGMLYRSSAYLPEAEEPREFQECPVFGATPAPKSILDLRWEGESPALAPDQDPQAVQYLPIPAQMYVGIFTAKGMENCRQLFSVFARRENYPVLFHCVVGADRTGTLAFLLQAVLGCSEEEIRRDYVFTSFYSTRYFSAVDTMLARMDDFAEAPEEPLQWKTERFLLRCGVSAREIREFQEIILGAGLTPSPVLQQAAAVEELLASFEETTQVAFVPPAAGNRLMLQCGQEFPFRGDNENYAAPDFVGANGQGEYLLRVHNGSSRVAAGAFQGEGLTAPAYLLLDPSRKFLNLSPSGNLAWTPQELAAGIQLPPKSETLALLKPVPQGEEPKAPQGYETRPWEEKAGEYLVAPAQETPPAWDGRLDEEFWAACKPVFLSQLDGSPATSGKVSLRVATNPQHDVLYLGVEFLEDATPAARKREHDGAVWEDDEVEFFLAGAGHATYYQLIVNRLGGTLDGRGTDIKWNFAEFTAVTAETGRGWSLEAAVPLAQLELKGALELNVCTTDFPSGIQRNLGATNGLFHSREALVPVFLK